MLTTIHITVRDRVPTITAGEDVISHNSDYVAEFEFDEEWQDKVKTVYFVCEDGSYQAVVMDGNSCDVPMMAGEHRRIFVGVQAGAAEKPSVLKTTRPCCLKVKDSIADYLGEQIPDPTPDVYEQIIAMLESITSPTWDSLQDKPFSTLGSGLSVDENGVLSAQGGGSANAVQYVAQELTDEQKAQARSNIDADKKRIVVEARRSSGGSTMVYYNVDDQNAAIDKFIAEYKAGTEILLRLYNRDYPLTNIDEDGIVYFSGYIYDAANKSVGVVTYKMEKNKAVVEESSLYGIKAISLDNQLKYKGYAADAKAVGDALGTKLDKNQGVGNAGKILGIGADGIVVPQDKPTYTLPQATADALGGIKADAATAEDTQVVRIGTDGKLRTTPTGGSSITVDDALSSTSENPVQNKVVTASLAEKITAPTTAAVGQIIKVKSVDSTGKPTEWKAADLPSGGGETWTLIKDITLGEDVASIEEQNLNLKKLYLTMAIVGTSQNTQSVNGELRINNEAYFYSNNIGANEGVKRWLASYVELIGDVKRHISTSNNNSPFQSNVTHSGYFGDGTVINALKILPFSIAGKYIGAGTRVKIYGISA